jgi:Tol biopolymer transport system component
VAGFSVSSNGTLAYLSGGLIGTNAGLRELVWVDRNGRETPTGAPIRSYGSFRLSPDGQKVAVDIRGADPGSIWVWDLARRTLNHLTTGADLALNPVWTRDSEHLAFNASRENAPVILLERADGVGAISVLSKVSYVQIPKTITPDGRSVVTASGRQLNLVPIDATQAAVALLKVSSAVNNPDVSPDGRWIAYESDEPGTREVYVRPLRDIDAGRWQVSTSGGEQPVWSRDGKELFFLDRDGFLNSVTVIARSQFATSVPKRVLQAPYYRPGSNRAYDVSPDGRRFLMLKAADGGDVRPSSIVVVSNWLQELERLLPSD